MAKKKAADPVAPDLPSGLDEQVSEHLAMTTVERLARRRAEKRREDADERVKLNAPPTPSEMGPVMQDAFAALYAAADKDQPTASIAAHAWRPVVITAVAAELDKLGLKATISLNPPAVVVTLPEPLSE